MGTGQWVGREAAVRRCVLLSPCGVLNHMVTRFVSCVRKVQNTQKKIFKEIHSLIGCSNVTRFIVFVFEIYCVFVYNYSDFKNHQ